MSRSVSPPSSVTNTSPCWNGDIVPGSTFRYGSNFCAWIVSPRALSSRPSDAATMPLPRPETTPPVTKTYFVGRIANSGIHPTERVELAQHRRLLDQRPEGTMLAEDGEACEGADCDPPASFRESIHGTQP